MRSRVLIALALLITAASSAMAQELAVKAGDGESVWDGFRAEALGASAGALTLYALADLGDWEIAETTFPVPYNSAPVTLGAPAASLTGAYVAVPSRVINRGSTGWDRRSGQPLACIQGRSWDVAIWV